MSPDQMQHNLSSVVTSENLYLFVQAQTQFILIDTYIILYTNQLFASTLFSTIFLCFFMLRLT
ncbi:hypothetical protein F160043M1_27910 [Anaerostipes hadrus]